MTTELDNGRPSAFLDPECLVPAAAEVADVVAEAAAAAGAAAGRAGRRIARHLGVNWVPYTRWLCWICSFCAWPALDLIWSSERHDFSDLFAGTVIAAAPFAAGLIVLRQAENRQHAEVRSAFLRKDKRAVIDGGGVPAECGQVMLSLQRRIETLAGEVGDLRCETVMMRDGLSAACAAAGMRPHLQLIVPEPLTGPILA